MFHKEGGPSILLGTVFAVAVLLIADKFIDISWLRMLVQIAGIIVLIIILQFFRNPKRIAIKNSDHILAPVDGKVVVIEEVYEGEFFKDKRLQVSIFMSPINVHVTRYAMDGIIKGSVADWVTAHLPGKVIFTWTN